MQPATAMLSSLKARRAEKADSKNKRILILQREVTDAEDRLKRLYRLVEDGVTDLDEYQVAHPTRFERVTFAFGAI